jgi:hypothetical protein
MANENGTTPSMFPDDAMLNRIRERVKAGAPDLTDDLLDAVIAEKMTLVEDMVVDNILRHMVTYNLTSKDGDEKFGLYF